MKKLNGFYFAGCLQVLWVLSCFGSAFPYVVTPGGSLTNGGLVSATNVWDKSNVRFWGAKGDKTNDDTVAIQTTADLNGGGYWYQGSVGGDVYLPPGNYVVTSPIVIKAQTRIHGSSEGSSQIFSYVSGDDTIKCNADSLVDPNHNHIVIENLTINMMTNSAGSAIHLYGSSKYVCPVIRNVMVWNYYGRALHGISLSQTMQGVIEHCHVKHTTSSGIFVSGSNNLLRSSANYCDYCGGDGFKIRSVEFTSSSDGADSNDGCGLYGEIVSFALFTFGAEANTGGGISLLGSYIGVIDAPYIVTETNGITLDGCNSISLDRCGTYSFDAGNLGWSLFLTNACYGIMDIGGFRPTATGEVNDYAQLDSITSSPFIAYEWFRRPIHADSLIVTGSVAGLSLSGGGEGVSNLLTANILINTNSAPATNTIVGFFWWTNGANIYKVPCLQ